MQWIQCEEPQMKEEEKNHRRYTDCVYLQISINEEANCSIRMNFDVSNRDRVSGDDGN